MASLKGIRLALKKEVECQRLLVMQTVQQPLCHSAQRKEERCLACDSGKARELVAVIRAMARAVTALMG